MNPIAFRDVHSFNRYTYAANNPYKYVDPDGRNFAIAVQGFTIGTLTCGPVCGGILGAALGIGGYIAGQAAVDAIFNESSDTTDTVDTDREIENLTEGLEPEVDAKGRPRKGQYVDPNGNSQEAMDDLTGDDDGNGGKDLPDGSKAGTHQSSGKSGGKAGNNTGSKTLHINRPSGKQDVKIRYPNEKSKLNY